MNTRDLLETILQRVAKVELLKREDLITVLGIELVPADQDTHEDQWLLRTKFAHHASCHAAEFHDIRICISPQTGTPTNIVTSQMMLECDDPIVKSISRFLEEQATKPAVREERNVIRRLADTNPL